MDNAHPTAPTSSDGSPLPIRTPGASRIPSPLTTGSAARPAGGTR